MNRVMSKDGTSIGYDRQGSGPAAILVTGGLDDGSENAPLAGELAQHFTVYNHNRRGRDHTGHTEPYALEREIEDIGALGRGRRRNREPLRRLVGWCSRPTDRGSGSRDRPARGVRRWPRADRPFRTDQATELGGHGRARRLVRARRGRDCCEPPRRNVSALKARGTWPTRRHSPRFSRGSSSRDSSSA
jgi:hypothetical protein